MTLSNRQIKSAITGAVRTVESNNGICAKRFTEKQEAVFALRHPNFPEDFFDGYFEETARPVPESHLILSPTLPTSHSASRKIPR